MTTKFLLLSALIATLLTACNKKDDSNKSKDSNGNCTPLFVNEYNGSKSSLTIALNAYKSNLYTLDEKLALTEKADLQCDSFFKNHNNVSCKIKRQNTDEFYTAYSSDVNNMCQINKSNLLYIKSQANSAILKAVPVANFQITVKNATLLNEIINNKNTSYVVSEGKIGEINTFIERFNNNGVSICSFKTQDDSTITLVDNSVLTLTFVDEIRNQGGLQEATLGIKDNYFIIQCIKRPTTPYKVIEIQEAFKELLDIKINP